MKIAVIVPITVLKSDPEIRHQWGGIGGSEISSFYVAKELSKRGHDVTILSFDSKEGLEEEIEGIFFRRYPPSRANLRSKDCIFLKRKVFNNFDIVHFYGPVLLRHSYLVKLLNDVKTIVTLNFYNIMCQKKISVMKNDKICNRCSFIDLLNCSSSISRALKTKLYRSLSFLNDAYILLSNNSKNIFKIFGFPGKKMYVVPNFIPKINYVNRTGNNGNSLIYIGRLDEVKGLDLLIRALPKVKSKIGDFKCYIVGESEGIERQRLEKLAMRLDVSNYVDFTGFVNHENLKEYYLKSDIFIFPVRWPEPFGRVLIEAMTYGLPIIASETVDSDVIDGAAVTFKNNDYNDLADKIIYLLSNKDLRERLSKAGKEHVKNFYPEKVIPRLEEIYKKIIQE